MTCHGPTSLEILLRDAANMHTQLVSNLKKRCGEFLCWTTEAADAITAGATAYKCNTLKGFDNGGDFAEETVSHHVEQLDSLAKRLRKNEANEQEVIVEFQKQTLAEW